MTRKSRSPCRWTFNVLVAADRRREAVGVAELVEEDVSLVTGLVDPVEGEPAAVRLADPEDDEAAAGVGEGAHRRPDLSGELLLGGLRLEGLGVAVAESVEEFGDVREGGHAGDKFFRLVGSPCLHAEHPSGGPVFPGGVGPVDRRHRPFRACLNTC